jgi:magnesium-transporting ATPase (P-type)
MTPERFQPFPWHSRPVDAVLSALDATRSGLSTAEAARRLVSHGPNALPQPRRSGVVRLYLGQFTNPLVYLLLAASAVSVAIGDLSDALFIFAVLQINAVVGTVQEWKAESGADALRKLIRNRTIVRRDGSDREIDSEGLVPGDIVRLDSGSQVPADLRLITAMSLKVQESLLTGESEPVGKDPDALATEDAPIGDRRTMLFAGTVVLGGRAEGVVATTGRNTEVGHIAETLAEVDTAVPPLVARLERFTRAIGLAVLASVVILGTALYAQGAPIAEIFLFAVALAVSAIPEGLPVGITVALAVASTRMARRNVIVRKLPAVEGLGACTVIASDKTGTLTYNEMTIRRVWLPGIGDFTVEGRGYEPQGRVTLQGVDLPAPARSALRQLAMSGALANEATLEVDGECVRHVGDTVDVAFLALAGKVGLARATLLDRYPQVAQVPYESAYRFAASLHRDDGRVIAHVKGSPEMVLEMCRQADRDGVGGEIERIGTDGFRVIAVASGTIDGGLPSDLANGCLADLHFLGLVGVVDPVRVEVPGAVERCHRAGVDVRMITGDHPATALAIARRLGLSVEKSHVVTGTMLADHTDNPAAMDAATVEAKVFARVEPLQKLTIVQSLQRAGHFVGVTGDGVNDAPALTAANIGVAMGKGGTDVARGAADLILTDDNFASIVNGIEEGRVAYDNVRKLSYLMLSTGAAELLMFFLSVVFGLPLPLFAVQLLWLNLVTDGFQGVPLAFERAEPGLLDQRPRPPGQSIFDRRMIEEVLLSGCYIGLIGFLYFAWALDQGWSEAEARNGLLLWMVMCENVHGFNCRSEWRSVFRVPLSSNWLLVGAVVAAHGAHIAAMYIPGLNTLLGIAPVSGSQWLQTAAMALSLILIMELYKILSPRPPVRAAA